MSVSEPGPYEERPLSPAARQEVRAFERLKLSKGDVVQLLLLDGTNLEGEYIQLEAPTATDPEMYVLLVPERKNGHRPNVPPAFHRVRGGRVAIRSIRALSSGPRSLLCAS